MSKYLLVQICIALKLLIFLQLLMALQSFDVQLTTTWWTTEDQLMTLKTNWRPTDDRQATYWQLTDNWLTTDWLPTDHWLLTIYSTSRWPTWYQNDSRMPTNWKPTKDQLKSEKSEMASQKVLRQSDLNLHQFCLTKDWLENWSERHLLVFCIHFIVPGFVVYHVNDVNLVIF